MHTTRFIQGAAIAIAFAISGASLVRAWISPPSPPPSQNVPAPLTVSAVDEIKAGLPNTFEGVLNVNDLYIQRIGKWASELTNLRGTRGLDFAVRSRVERTIASPSQTCVYRYGLFNCRMLAQVECPAEYYVVGCSGGSSLDMRRNAVLVNGLPTQCPNNDCAYIGSVPYPSAAGAPGVQNTGCAAEMYVRVPPDQLNRPTQPAFSQTGGLAVYAFCARKQ